MMLVNKPGASRQIIILINGEDLKYISKSWGQKDTLSAA
jgi:hypothetical protein